MSGGDFVNCIFQLCNDYEMNFNTVLNVHLRLDAFVHFQVKANELRSEMIEKAREAGGSGTQTTSDIMGSTLRDAHPDALASMSKKSCMYQEWQYYTSVIQPKTHCATHMAVLH